MLTCRDTLAPSPVYVCLTTKAIMLSYGLRRSASEALGYVKKWSMIELFDLGAFRIREIRVYFLVGVSRFPCNVYLPSYVATEFGIQLQW